MQDTTKSQQFTALLTEHRAKLRKVILTYATSREDREDLYQEILGQIWQSFGRYDPQRPFATWMYRVALNVAISHVRRTTRRPPETSAVEGVEFDPPDPNSAAGETDERTLVLQRLLASLDELDRALLLLHLEERSYEEIAHVLGLSPSNVGTKLSRLREHLGSMATKEMEG